MSIGPNLFTSASGIPNINYLVADSAEELLKQIWSLKREPVIISIYTQGSKHYAWIKTNDKIKKITKKGAK